MHPSPATEPAPLCIWMSAGLIRYRLCDRGFDCEHCPLDAALRGDATAAPAPEPALGAAAGSAPRFPDDRFYLPGHQWLQELPDGLRYGIDALAAALVGAPRAVAWRDDAEKVVCELDLWCGLLPLAAAPRGRWRRNPQLAEHPELLASDPYGAGWTLESAGAAPPQGLDAAAARAGAALDLRHLRRRIALEMLSDDEIGITLADGGEPVTDLRGLLGGQRYLALLRELVH